MRKSIAVALAVMLSSVSFVGTAQADRWHGARGHYYVHGHHAYRPAVRPYAYRHVYRPYAYRPYAYRPYGYGVAAGAAVGIAAGAVVGAAVAAPGYYGVPDYYGAPEYDDPTYRENSK